jgi:uncharacterized BrkB/YihY/UPF0761 family membrane protein
MANPSYRALRIILGIVSAFTAAAGLLLVFSGKPLVMRLLLRPPEEVSTLLLFVMRELGGLALMLSVLFFFASRDPVRNVAIVDALIVGLCILAITFAIALHSGHSPTLSGLPNLGTIPDSVGTGSCALFHAAATEP